jgi:sulfur carrier protein
MDFVVNGEPMKSAARSVLDLLQELAIDPRRVAVELNRDIVPKQEYGATVLNDGDRIEIVQFVGGG